MKNRLTTKRFSCKVFRVAARRWDVSKSPTASQQSITCWRTIEIVRSDLLWKQVFNEPLVRFLHCSHWTLKIKDRIIHRPWRFFKRFSESNRKIAREDIRSKTNGQNKSQAFRSGQNWTCNCLAPSKRIVSRGVKLAWRSVNKIFSMAVKARSASEPTHRAPRSGVAIGR